MQCRLLTIQRADSTTNTASFISTCRLNNQHCIIHFNVPTQQPTLHPLFQRSDSTTLHPSFQRADSTTDIASFISMCRLNNQQFILHFTCGLNNYCILHLNVPTQQPTLHPLFQRADSTANAASFILTCRLNKQHCILHFNVPTQQPTLHPSCQRADSTTNTASFMSTYRLNNQHYILHFNLPT